MAKGKQVTIQKRKYHCYAKRVRAFGKKGSKRGRTVTRAFCKRAKK